MFYKLPQTLFKDKRYNGLSNDAKLLYAFLLSRSDLSFKNNWVDENFKPYIYCTREEMAGVLNVSSPTAIKIFRQLRDAGLVTVGRKDGKACAKIYVTSLLSRSNAIPAASDTNRIQDTTSILLARFMEM